MKSLESRRYVIAAIFLVIGVIFLIRLFFIQVVDDSYKLSARNQALRYVTQYPVRGLIYDRNEKLLVYNEAAYDLMVIPRQVSDDMDTLAFCELIGIDTAAFSEKLTNAKSYSRYKASAFEKQIPADQWTAIAERLYNYPGFYGEKRTLRKYPRPVASHILGYISEVSPRDMEKDPYYQRGDYRGKSGLELSYEEVLRGKRGVRIYMVDVHNRVKGSYEEGLYDTASVPGRNLISTIDRDLQEYGHQLMQGKRGTIVAIEPATGEILTMVSAPDYDPNLLVGRERTKNYKMLVANDSLDPLFNRATNAVYRPGSIFKLVQSLIAQKRDVITPQTRFRCNRGIIGCHGSHTNDDLVGAIQHSCNPYFWNVYKRLIQQGEYSSIFKDAAYGLKQWKEDANTFGFGVRLQTDIPNVSSGMVPGVSFYNKWYGENRWAFSTIYSNSIGEGELGVIPLQMANLAATIANKGYYYTPHFIRAIEDSAFTDSLFHTRVETGVDTAHFNPVIAAMSKVVNELGGTARRARLDSIEVCGKTGTVQNDPRPDHSVFIAFAPRENPKIAIAVYVEYSDYGGLWAAPVSSLMINKYLGQPMTDKLKKREQRIFDAEFLEIYEN